MVGHWAGFFHHLVAAILFGVTRFPDRDETGAHRRSRDDTHGSVLPDQRAVSVYWLDMGCAAGPCAGVRPLLNFNAMRF
jgi:hypothetical protein